MSESRNAVRRALVAAVVAIAMVTGFSALGATGASAEQARPSGTVVGKSDAGKITSTVVGRTSTGDKVTGSFTPIKVVQQDGALAMKGFLQGVVTDDQGTKTRFSGVKVMPVKSINGAAVTSAKALNRAAACDILNLVLGPLDLNILGLQINLQQVVLDIVAVPGAGQLLGNLLCAVAGLLDGGLGGVLGGLLGQLQTLLNQILGLLNLGV